MLLRVAFISCVFLLLVAPLRGAVEEHDFHKFPADRVALHMPCEESNMFATKCMCHIICDDKACSSARKICEKYGKERGCKYMLMRSIGGKRVATLKRTPTQEELDRFDISMYPSTKEALSVSTGDRQGPQGANVSSLLRHIVTDLGMEGQEIVNRMTKPLSRKYCGKGVNSTYSTGGSFLDRGIALVALSYRTPKTFLNSLRTWRSSGLLDLVSEKVALLNDPLPQEHAMALEHGLCVVQPKDFAHAKMNKPNVFTIGAAFYYALQVIDSEYMLFLENDFKMDTSLSRKKIQMELITAAGLLDGGAEVVRLISRKYQGCGTFKTCDHHGIHLQSPNPGDRKRNWYSFYCPGHPGTEKYVSDCTTEPRYRCFTSWDSNWSLNAVMVKKSSMTARKFALRNGAKKTIAEIGLSQYQQQDGFESVMLQGWQQWRLPICISYDGLFIHEEIETSA